MINIRDLLTLADKKEYVVAGKAKLEGENYYLLCEIENTMNIKFCHEQVEGEKTFMIVLNEKKDEEKIKKLLPLFEQSLKKVIKK